jgi:asparagine synthase (glutamine-hydrolysing)
MCGICGELDTRKIVEKALIERMCDVLTHRGPDDHGLYVGDSIGLGSRRLSIIDLSSAGHMPMSTPSGKLWITYNGEIYNYHEIRKQLQDCGYSFRSNTDTEVVLYAYEKWGTDCLLKFNGMYAITIWDEEKKNLFLARDRLGIKPLYYYYDGTKIIFASEMKAILQDSRVPREFSYEGVINYFTFGHSMAPHTIFKNIYKLPPGHYLTCRLEGEAKLQMAITRYWAPPVPQGLKDEGEQYYIEEIRRLLGKSVKSQLISDVPLGVFLSGGMDSSIVTGLMSSVDSTRVKTFSIGFSIGDAAYNELDDARLVARHFGTEHHELLLDDRALLQILPDLIYHYDEPFGDSASFPTYLLSKFTRENVTVALSGEGGDEIFGGYRRYVVENLFYRHPGIVGLLDNNVLRKLSSSLPGMNRLKRTLASLKIKDGAERYASWLTVFNEKMRRRLLKEDFVVEGPAYDPLDIYRRLYIQDGAATAGGLLYIDQQTWLPDTYLEKADKASMAHSLEVRVPFLDHELVEFTARIPVKYKIRGFSTKCILKKAFASLLPRAILKKRKHGFTPPIEPWFRGKLKDDIKEIIFDPKARSRGLFNYDYIEEIFRQHTEGKAAYHRHLWLLVVFELWCQRYLDSVTVR